MVSSDLVLVTGAGGCTGGVSRIVLDWLLAQGVSVRAMVHLNDHRADELRALGAEVVVGNLTRRADVADALDSAGRMYFNMSVSPDHLLAATVVATVAREYSHLDCMGLPAFGHRGLRCPSPGPRTTRIESDSEEFRSQVVQCRDVLQRRSAATGSKTSMV
ncbi:NAD(P)H-binding protein [Streptomyces atratus]|uniref:NAD(P)H-binding protein n=1 Tax=Streptomyces atratus TaxID=1893 RepID=UPI0036878526